MENIFSLLLHYKYLILLPLSIVEGPIITVIAGFLCANHSLQPFFVFPILVVGDMTGDLFYYSLGRWSDKPFARKIAYALGVSPRKLLAAKEFIYNNPAKTILLSKTILGIGVLGLIMAGNARFPIRRYLGLCVLVTLLQSVCYLIIGFLFGHLFFQIDKYLNWFAGGTVILLLGILLFFGLKSLKKAI